MKRRALVCLYLLVGVLAVALCVLPAQAQNNAPLKLGTWGLPFPPLSGCQGLPNCQSVTISCPNTEPLVATYAQEFPQSGNPIGTIVMFSGLGGTSPSTDTGQEDAFSLYYTQQGYEVVQFFWATDWEDATNGNGPGQGVPAWNMQVGGCRPATFLNYAYSKLAYHPTTTGFCAQGQSGGAGAIAYSMAWYGAGSGQSGYPPLDKVELAVGPPFSDIEQGCEEPETLAPPLYICPSGQTQKCICPSGSSNWCVGWSGESFSPAYDQSATSELIKWTGDNTCQNPNGNTSSTSNSKWYNQSIVESATGTASFQYPNTNMQAWLCASVQGTGSVNQNMPQGWLFYQQVANAEA
jgi:hypothetical protein